MSELINDVVDVEDRERLVQEISLLRGKVARLQERVEQLDQLAHLDSLPLSVAIGVGMIDALDTAEAVMERADEAMYRRKAAA